MQLSREKAEKQAWNSPICSVGRRIQRLLLLHSVTGKWLANHEAGQNDAVYFSSSTSFSNDHRRKKTQLSSFSWKFQVAKTAQSELSFNHFKRSLLPNHIRILAAFLTLAQTCLKGSVGFHAGIQRRIENRNFSLRKKVFGEEEEASKVTQLPLRKRPEMNNKRASSSRRRVRESEIRRQELHLIQTKRWFKTGQHKQKSLFWEARRKARRGE